MEQRQRQLCIRYSRVVGYLSPLTQWNEGKISEYKDRVMFDVGGKL
jgi:ribonucleoside-triphosphate reductase